MYNWSHSDAIGTESRITQSTHGERQQAVDLKSLTLTPFAYRDHTSSSVFTVQVLCRLVTGPASNRNQPSGSDQSQLRLSLRPPI